MKHIIVPIDFSEESANGLKMAIFYANQFKANLRMIYVEKTSSEIDRVNIGEEHSKVTAGFEKIFKENKPKFHDPSKFDYIIKKGKVYQEVVKEADALSNPVIILSTHGASGFEELFIGSNALKIISASDKPVITVRHGAVSRDIKTIVLPIDSSLNTRQKVPYTALIASTFDAEIHVLGVCTSSSNDLLKRLNSYSGQTCEYLVKQGVKHRSVTVTGKGMASSILEYADKVNADLISIMTEQSGSLSDFIIGTNAQQVISKSNVPVLNITPKEVSVKGSFSTSG
jgi:nucleotide-binding universal stress UspA family protein